MPKTLWQEGRVLGYSAYELYLKHMYDNNMNPVDESAWLASTLSYGASLLLWVAPDSTENAHYRDFPLPTGSNLGAANTIMASFFSGEGAADANGWATKVTSYGPLIENDSTASPSGTTIPVKDDGAVEANTRLRVQDFAKITDGIVIQPGTWSANTSSPPTKKVAVDLTQVPTLRLAFSDQIVNGFWLLLSGFTDRGVTMGMTSQTDSTDTSTNGSKNGAFLGPAIYPWAAKVVFSIPPIIMGLIQADVNIGTKDIAAIQIYNTRYIWPFCTDAYSGTPSPTDLADSKQLYQLRGVTGYVSDAFINTYCVNLAKVLGACEEGHISDGYKFQMSYLKQLRAIYGNGPDVDDIIDANYVFFFWTNQAAINNSGQQGMFYPVNKHTKSFAFTLTDDNHKMQCTHGFNFTGYLATPDTSVMPTTSNDIMGTLYDVTNDYTVQTGSFKDVNDEYVFQNHPVLHFSVKEFQTFTRAMPAVPKAPTGYNMQFVDWFASLPLIEALGMGNADPTTRGEEVFAAMGIHSSYKDIDFQSFLQYAAAQRDLTQPITADASTIPVTDTFYMYSKSTIETIADSGFSWNSGTVLKQASAEVKASTTSANYYKPANLTISTISVTASIDTSQTPPRVVIDDIDPITDVTKECSGTSYHRWASVVSNESNEVKALSLVDDMGAYLSTAGASGSIDADVIRWVDILDALSLNKCIDILGGLINLKNSGSNYIQLATSLRLYISATEPTGAIPEGSVGIGWGSGIYKYTSGAWTVIS